MDAPSSIEQRKADHIRINLEEDVHAHTVTTGFEHYRFVHQALPELDLGDIDTSTTFLGFPLAVPFLISSMTGGLEKGAEINRNLARGAAAMGCAMGVGSQRVALEDPLHVRHFAVDEDLVLFANLGAVQLNHGYGVEECRRVVDMIGARALILHLNPLQEALQTGGNRNFSGLLSRISAVCDALGVPVIVKEIGFGISGQVARQLAEAGVAAIDVAGAGGTSWSAVEQYRAETALTWRLGATFRDWGIPTATSLLLAREAAPGLPLIASGGLRTGLDAAKAIALGATLAGYAGPLLAAATVSDEAVIELLGALKAELTLAMFCTGSANLNQLREAEFLVLQEDIAQAPVGSTA